ncbi:hypothetical protein DPMN_080588 [Dreissena polymorpha]|uniref:Uncharacterized protein n=1 Tax=Dreissena polymorpha TaxID=45954 RepID=A0A9D4BTZ3_DREPO|nr:hypothetical protein DPMN_080588 [Dreissena polymorpha]
MKNDPLPGGHAFQPTGIIFELVQHIIGINLLTKFHEDRTINVASRVLTRKNAPPRGGHVFQTTGIIFKRVQDIIEMNLTKVLTRKNFPPLGSHVFQANVTIFKLIQYIIKTNILTKFHEDWIINVASRVIIRFYYSHIIKNAPLPGGHAFQPTGIIFELVQHIIGINLLTKFHEDRTINVALEKNAPPPGGHGFQTTGIIFKLV